MIFLTYEFVCFATVFFAVYYICPIPGLRKYLILLSGVGVLYLYGGLLSVVVALGLLAMTLIAVLARRGRALMVGIVGVAAALVYFKYTGFILDNLLALDPASADRVASLEKIVPVAVPLGVSFFTFEFIHYLSDVRHGRRPIEKIEDALCFGLFWPTMVAGPIKRYEQFVPALDRGVGGPTRDDLANGLVRIAIGFVKKWAADNLTGWIGFFEPHYDSASHIDRWLFLAALAARILLDFSGYSDIAIGFARMLGVQVPENFNWPYIARSLSDFWQRWHMSLSSWIRDYIYIPLGGNRLGSGRRIANGLTAMVLCGLWHGASWNFALWGLYHGIGLAAGSTVTRQTDRMSEFFYGDRRYVRVGRVGVGALSWAATLVFVAVGWLFFFYPVERALRMAFLLVAR